MRCCLLVFLLKQKFGWLMNCRINCCKNWSVVILGCLWGVLLCLVRSNCIIICVQSFRLMSWYRKLQQFILNVKWKCLLCLMMFGLFIQNSFFLISVNRQKLIMMVCLFVFRKLVICCFSLGLLSIGLILNLLKFVVFFRIF